MIGKTLLGAGSFLAKNWKSALIWTGVVGAGTPIVAKGALDATAGEGNVASQFIQDHVMDTQISFAHNVASNVGYVANELSEPARDAFAEGLEKGQKSEFELPALFGQVNAPAVAQAQAPGQPGQANAPAAAAPHAGNPHAAAPGEGFTFEGAKDTAYKGADNAWDWFWDRWNSDNKAFGPMATGGAGLGLVMLGKLGMPFVGKMGSVLTAGAIGLTGWRMYSNGQEMRHDVKEVFTGIDTAEVTIPRSNSLPTVPDLAPGMQIENIAQMPPVDQALAALGSPMSLGKGMTNTPPALPVSSGRALAMN